MGLQVGVGEATDQALVIGKQNWSPAPKIFVEIGTRDLPIPGPLYGNERFSVPGNEHNKVP